MRFSISELRVCTYIGLGWIWTGVTNGFPGVKLSWSRKIYGSFNVSIVKIIIKVKNPNMFLIHKYR